MLLHNKILLSLIYIVIILVTLSICKISYKGNPATTIGEIHHYYIYDTAVKEIMKELLYEQMHEILYGYDYKATIPEGINHWWEDPPGRDGTHIFPGGFVDKIFQ